MALTLFGGARSRQIPDDYKKLNLELDYRLELVIEALRVKQRTILHALIEARGPR